MRILALASVIALSITGVASAQFSGVSSTYASRDLVLQRGTMRIDAGPKLPIYPGAAMRGATLGFNFNDGQDFVYANLGATFGIADDVEIGILAVPLLLSPDTDYRDPVLHGTYRFSRGELEAGLFVGFDLPVEGNLDLAVGLPIVLHAGREARVDIAAMLHIAFDDDETPFDLMFPFELAFNATPQLFLGPETGVIIRLADGNDRVQVPVGFFLGYTVSQVADLRGEFRVSSIGDGFDMVELLFRADWHIDL